MMTMMLCGREGNRRSGIALAMRHSFSGLSTYGLNGHGKEDEHLTYAPQGHGPPYFTYCNTRNGQVSQVTEGLLQASYA